MYSRINFNDFIPKESCLILEMKYDVIYFKYDPINLMEKLLGSHLICFQNETLINTIKRE